METKGEGSVLYVAVTLLWSLWVMERERGWEGGNGYIGPHNEREIKRGEGECTYELARFRLGKQN